MLNELRENTQARDIVRKAFNGQNNLITPDVIGYYLSKYYAIELSKGEGITREPIYGVTVVVRMTGEPDHQLSSCFHSRDEAERFIIGLKNK